MTRFGIVLALLTCVLGQPAPVLAWGSIGHRVVGQVADAHLTPTAQKAASAIMGSCSLGDVANWMDKVRKTPEGKAMKPWHFQSVDLCHPSLANCEDCARHQIKQAIETLKTDHGSDDASRARRLKALRVLVHLVGDVHQPLHAAENGDFGGNSVTLENRKCPGWDKNDKPITVLCKLHTYWDNILVKKAQGEENEHQFVARLAAMSVSADGDPDSWITESNALASTKVHTYERFACNIGKNSVEISREYDDTAVPVVTEQLAKAGARLAATLNDIYK